MQETKTTQPVFMKISDAAACTGLSRFFLRQGCKNNSVPHIKSGTTYYVNVPKLLELLNKMGGLGE